MWKIELGEKISSNTKDLITHEGKIFDLGYLGTMYHVLTKLLGTNSMKRKY